MDERWTYLARRRLLELAAAFAIARLLVQVLLALSRFLFESARPPERTSGFSNLLFGPAPPQYVTSAGNHILVYGLPLFALGATVLALPIGFAVVRRLGFRSWSDAELRRCPSCRARVVARATVCRFCTRAIGAAA